MKFTTITRNAGFDAIISKMSELAVNDALKVFGVDEATRYRNTVSARSNRRFVEGALASMDFETFKAFHNYRKAVMTH